MIFEQVDKNKDGFIEKAELYAAAVESKHLRAVLEESMKAVKKVDKIIENDLEEPFQSWVPISGNLVNFKEGIHFPTTKSLVDMVKENENVIIFLLSLTLIDKIQGQSDETGI
jgi:hypothetical protein